MFFYILRMMEEYVELLIGVMEYFIGVFKIGVKFDILYDFEFYVLEVGCWLGFGEVFNFYGYR